VDAYQTGHLSVGPDRKQRWLAVAAAALVAASVLPPLEVLARRYLFVEAIQFCVFALAAPALAVLGAPWRQSLPGAGRLVRLADAGRRRPVAGALGYLIAWALICLVWRLPPVLDGLARHPALIVPEAVTLCAAGLGLWRELVHPLRLHRAQRAGVAALAMWSLWVFAYVLGFASHPVVPAYDLGSRLLPVDDQEITAFVLWLAAAVAFFPIGFTTVLAWLREDSAPAPEPRADRPAPVPAVRGWEHRGRGRRRASAR
jgi:cytochrome c oxidase assembly factor CtaG